MYSGQPVFWRPRNINRVGEMGMVISMVSYMSAGPWNIGGRL